jgi:hypothetical protein
LLGASFDEEEDDSFEKEDDSFEKEAHMKDSHPPPKNLVEVVSIVISSPKNHDVTSFGILLFSNDLDVFFSVVLLRTFSLHSITHIFIIG